ncbi:arsenate-mycothiol transferase ArsC [Acaryochloris marina]|uniref:Protein tyrosine phosphatase, putative n=1 Tax=Acaryochloris marina (strain MBIC 11017) TaxID=329726 RepID=B0C7G9_ACAM1|nr:low molecular weight phosphatase family protein [Acaryochloris marina]ABW31253.1 protein tyrosine phosphatase, putative [Acaryochloris marina MBIC11017]BDM79933.1 low molecular weight phosphatase family protein [Acaryochloris marina MBIC10699]
MQTILFICTGNYYRSRFSEHYFNHLAAQKELGWRAESRGLALEWGQNNDGPISKYARQGLLSRNIQLSDELRFPLPLTLADLNASHQVIAVDETEHRPLMHARFPDWENKIDYWCVHDIDRENPEEALKQLENHIQDLISRL